MFDPVLVRTCFFRGTSGALHGAPVGHLWASDMGTCAVPQRSPIDNAPAIRYSPSHRITKRTDHMDPLLILLLVTIAATGWTLSRPIVKALRLR